MEELGFDSTLWKLSHPMNEVLVSCAGHRAGQEVVHQRGCLRPKPSLDTALYLLHWESVIQSKLWRKSTIKYLLVSTQPIVQFIQVQSSIHKRAWRIVVSKKSEVRRSYQSLLLSSLCLTLHFPVESPTPRHGCNINHITPSFYIPPTTHLFINKLHKKSYPSFVPKHFYSSPGYVCTISGILHPFYTLSFALKACPSILIMSYTSS